MLIKLLEDTYRVEAFEFQQLVLDNPYIKDVEVTVAVRNGQHYVKLEHELLDQDFHVEDNFSLRTPYGDEGYGAQAKTAYKAAFPIIIGLKAGFAISETDEAEVQDFDLEVEDDTVKMLCYRDTDAWSPGPNVSDIDFGFSLTWDVKKQCFFYDDENGKSDDELRTIAAIKHRVVKGLAELEALRDKAKSA